ncbi:hypothetical protein BDQ17DRAFT_1332731 [Cyathus striatus]|nr:hypothetical protein BDQ17DRAFT_1332731 [Cyathus striatus]
MKAAEDAAVDAEGIPDLTVAERVLEESGLPIAPPKRGPALNVPQPATPAFTITCKGNSDMKKVEEESESSESETNNKSKSKENIENTEDSGDKLSVGDKEESDGNDGSDISNEKYTEEQTSKDKANILKGSDISNEKHTEDQTSKDKDGNDNSQNKDVHQSAHPIPPAKPGTVDTVDIAMISPKGSLRSKGGILRGNAFRNCLNAANFSSAVESTIIGPVKG